MGERITNNLFTILMAEDDDGHAELMRVHFLEAGINNPILRFKDGQSIIDYLMEQSSKNQRFTESSFVTLLDIRMPKLDGIEVLRRIKADPRLKKMPVLIFTTTDDPREIDCCYRLGCNAYLSKPVEFGSFSETIRILSSYLSILRVPKMGDEK